MSISHLKKQYLNGRSVFGRNTLDHYCMNATENQMIYRTDVLSSVWNYCKARGKDMWISSHIPKAHTHRWNFSISLFINLF